MIKDKLIRINYIQLGLWIINTIGLLILTIMPKQIKIVEDLFLLFIILYVIMPILLMLAKLVITYYYKYKDDNYFASLPFIGTSVIMPMILFYFLSSLKDQGKVIVIVISAIIFIYNVVAIFISHKNKSSWKLYLILLSISLILYLINIYTVINVSYNYSVNW